MENLRYIRPLALMGKIDPPLMEIPHPRIIKGRDLKYIRRILCHFFRFFSSIRLVFILPLFLLFSCGGGDDSSTSGGVSSLTITWAGFPSSGILGSSSEVLPDPVISPAADSFRITNKTQNCQWDDIAKKIVFEGLGNCILSVTAKKQGLPEKTQEIYG